MAIHILLRDDLSLAQGANQKLHQYTIRIEFRILSISIRKYARSL